MTKIIKSAFTVGFISVLGIGQIKSQDTKLPCQVNWIYIDLHKEIKGKIIFYAQPVVACGIVSVAATALIETESGDTIRVLSLCHIKKDFQTKNDFETGSSVLVTPSEKPKFRVDITPADPKHCTLKETYFGTLKIRE